MKVRVMQDLRRAQEQNSTGKKFRFNSPSLNLKQFKRKVMLKKRKKKAKQSKIESNFSQRKTARINCTDFLRCIRTDRPEKNQRPMLPRDNYGDT